MSRHEITAKDPNWTCVVGWDHGLETYFAQVRDEEVERAACEAAERIVEDCRSTGRANAADRIAANRDSMIFWVGAECVREITTVEELAARLAPYAELSPEMRETLREDREREEATPRTDHQLKMLDFVMRSSGVAGHE